MRGVQMRRTWAMPSPDTFDCAPLGEFVKRRLLTARVSVDPFARNRRWATYTNDLNPDTAAACHEDAVVFLGRLASDGVRPDLFIVDPPYSPRQISEVYGSIGLSVGMKETQTAALYANVRRCINELAKPGATALWFGWNSVGQGAPWILEEVLVVCHGGAHNDTIATAWRLPEPEASLFGAAPPQPPRGAEGEG